MLAETGLKKKKKKTVILLFEIQGEFVHDERISMCVVTDLAEDGKRWLTCVL